jgi:protein phosphatase
MPEYVIRVGSISAQGVRPNNEDSLVVDLEQQVFLVADGMGGQDRGEVASSMAAELMPRLLREQLANQTDPLSAVRQAVLLANQAIVDAGAEQAAGRRMGTTVVVAVRHDDTIYVTGVGDSRVYLVREGRVEQLTVDHSVAKFLELCGTLTPDEANESPLQHVLYRFMGCAELTEGIEVKRLLPQLGDRLVLGSDGLTNLIDDADLIEGARNFPDPQTWADHLVHLALDRGSRDNVTCVVVAFDPPDTVAPKRNPLGETDPYLPILEP